MNYDNPFQHVPSASKLGRVMECPASHKAELAAGDVPEDLSDANEGTDVHAVLSDDLSADDVSYSAAQTAEMCGDQTERLLNEWQTEGDAPLGFKELRYGLTDIGAVVPVNGSTRANVVFTGQFDRLYTQKRDCDKCSGKGTVAYLGSSQSQSCPKCKGIGKLNHGLLIDFKALHGKHKSAIENPQLMGLAVLVAKRHTMASLRVALVQPWKGKPTVADYGQSALALAHSFLDAALVSERIATPENRKAGDHCKYCKARFSCSALRDSSINALNIVQPETLPADPATRNKAIFARVDEFTPAQSLHIEKNVKGFLRAFLAAHDAKFRKFVEDGDMPGHILREKSGKRKITDVATAYERAAAFGVTADAFTGKCTLSLKGLNEVLKDATKAKGKALEAIADTVLHGITDTGKPVFEVVENNRIDQ
jgi:hypothetical protein